MIRYFDAKIKGLSRIPKTGGALLVGNHALLGIDSAILQSLVHQRCGRKLWFLAERNLWKVPFVHNVVEAAGGVIGSPENAQQLLGRGELVCVYPGGVDDSWKLTGRDRYQMLWGSRMGFARVAIEMGVPIIPVAGLGIDDIYTVFGRERWLGRKIFGSAKYDLPLLFGWRGTLLPRPVRVEFHALDPISTVGMRADCEADVRSARDAVFATLDHFLQKSDARYRASRMRDRPTDTMPRSRDR